MGIRNYAALRHGWREGGRKESVCDMRHKPHMLEDTFGRWNTTGFVEIFKTPDVPTACARCCKCTVSVCYSSTVRSFQERAPVNSERNL